MTTKERIVQAIQELPDGASIEDAMERLLFLAKIEGGLEKADAGETMLNVDERAYSINVLAKELLVRKQGRKIAYLTDFIFEKNRIEEIARFAWQSDILCATYP